MHWVGVTAPCAVRLAPYSLLSGSNYESAPHLLCSSAQLPTAGRRPHPLTTGPRLAARAAGWRPALSSRDSPALHARSDWLSRPRGWVLAYSSAPQRGCSFQTSTVTFPHRLRRRSREPPHGEVRSQLLAVVQKSKSGSCHAWSYPAPHGARAGERVLSCPPAWGGTGAPLEGAASGEPAAA
ncbi:uncharacterized protein LOC116756832 isoform X2 [Phocoena sinus]|nr:uncharacterized protein LOC116756832 isoform X2 [Phocoena sinus]